MSLPVPTIDQTISQAASQAAQTVATQAVAALEARLAALEARAAAPVATAVDTGIAALPGIEAHLIQRIETDPWLDRVLILAVAGVLLAAGFVVFVGWLVGNKQASDIAVAAPAFLASVVLPLVAKLLVQRPPAPTPVAPVAAKPVA